MVKSCCAYNCTERANGSNFISFHRFPKHPELRKKWIIATKREDFIPTENTRICGKPFLESDFIIHFGKRQLKKDVIPSVFNFPEHLCKNKKTRRILKRRRSFPTSYFSLMLITLACVWKRIQGSIHSFIISMECPNLTVEATPNPLSAPTPVALTTTDLHSFNAPASSNKRPPTDDVDEETSEPNSLDLSLDGKSKKLKASDSTESLTPMSDLLLPARELITEKHDIFPLDFNQTVEFMGKAHGEKDILPLIYKYTDDAEADEVLSTFHVSNIPTKTPGTESLFLKLSNKDTTLLLGCIYRPPSSVVDNDKILVESLSHLADSYATLLLFGDFNMPDITWPIDPRCSYKPSSQLFVDLLTHSHLRQLVTQPTRHRLNQNPSTLDLIVCSDDHSLTNLDYLAPIGISDHSTLKIDLQICQSPRRRTVSFTRTVTDYRAVNNDLAKTNWEALLSDESIVKNWSTFKNTLQSLLHRHTKSFFVKQSSTKPWINGRLLQQINRKRALWRTYKRSGSELDYRIHREFSNRLSTAIKEARCVYEKNVAEAKDAKKLYKYIRTKFTGPVSTPRLKNTFGEVLDNNKIIADTFADAFSNVFTIEPSGCLPKLNNICKPISFSDISFTTDVVHKKLKQLKVSKSPGPDLITAKTLHECADTLSEVLCILMKQSFDSGTLPADWKIATDLGVTISSDLSWSQHIIRVVKKANSVLYLLSKAFCKPSYSTFVKLYKSFVRPILEFANAVWTPILQRDLLLLESVQRRATRVPFGRTRPQYSERLSLMNLTSLTQRRLRGDLIVTFQALTNQLSPIRHLFTLNTDQRTRGHRFKLLRELFRTTIRQFFISNRVFHHWNSLRDEIVSSPSVISFKIRYDTLDVAST
ncbi:hypothetical protein Zmor_013731 [Zophobas morio]|uniref:THAP-type domain-containing protein n=1 Tax=Zophobas morio TaxID=2755281 RepID=A0AA38IIF6_9CUCU|nr:hypothetical protein Zmor_013731 [Zophobas morio]